MSLERSLELAEAARGQAYPKPTVGAVVMRDGAVVGEGVTEPDGRHGEVVALAAAGARARGGTLYVTLEPCTHHGKTPPCVDAIRAAGIADERVVLDPGLGFAKRGDHNWELLAGLDDIAGLGFPLLVGASRKSFLGTLLAEPDSTPRPVAEREVAGHAVTLLLAQRGVWGVRVHDVRGTRDVLRVWERTRSGRTSDE